MEDKRKIPRVLVHWRSAIVVAANGEQSTIEGISHDISSEGVSVICHRNIPLNRAVTVCLLIRTGNRDNPELVVEAQGKVVYCVLSGEQGGFRVGIQFLKFAGESKNILERYMPKAIVYGLPSTVAATVETTG
ncbi:MAG: PilZ domain-containing protein [Sterolibacterium sp.]|jgi:hypothetical protein